MKKNIIRVLCLLLAVVMLGTLVLAAGVPAEVLAAKESVVRIVAENDKEWSSGTGFVISNTGGTVLVATNNHVIEGDYDTITVYYGESQTAKAEIVGATADRDLCILQLSGKVMLDPISLSMTEAQQGDGVYAIGFPGAADALYEANATSSSEVTITDGIISAVRETTVVDNGPTVTLLQNTAAINSGNSGGPLFNEAGEVIGITTYSVEDSQGVFGAIAISELISYASELELELNGGTAGETGSSDPDNAAAAESEEAAAENAEQSSAPVLLILAIVAAIIVILTVLVILKVNKPKKIKVIIGVCGLLFAVGLFSGAYFAEYSKAVKAVKAGDLETAEQHLQLSALTRIHDADLVNYVEAHNNYESGDYSEAYDLYAKCRDYLDSAVLIEECQLNMAENLAASGDYDGAMAIYESYGRDDLIIELKKTQIQSLLDARDYDGAEALCDELSDSGCEDAESLKNEIVLQQGLDMLYIDSDYTGAKQYFYFLKKDGVEGAEDKYNEAILAEAQDQMENSADVEKAYSTIVSLADEGYSKATDYLPEAKYILANTYMNDGRCYDAYCLMLEIKDYGDVSQNLETVKASAYAELVNTYNQIGVAAGINTHELQERFNAFGDYEDCKLYSTLLQAYAYGSKSVIQESTDFTDSDLAFLCENIDKANVKDVLMFSGIFSRFLYGSWYASNSQDHADFSLSTLDKNFINDEHYKPDSVYLEYSLSGSRFSDDIFWIDGKYLQVYDEQLEDLKNILSITINTADSIDVYCYANGKTYTLYRS